MLELTYTFKSQEKARKTRYLNEKKWRWLRIVRRSMAAITVGIPAIGYFIDVKVNNNPSLALFTACSTLLLLGMLNAIPAIMKDKLTADGLGNLYDEKFYVHDGVLHRIYRNEAGAGWNVFKGSKIISEMIVPLNSIQNLIYDPRSKRIEFTCTSHFSMYSNWEQQIKVRPTDVAINNRLFFYDYYTPSLIETMKQQGIPCTEQTIEYVYMRGIQAEKSAGKCTSLSKIDGKRQAINCNKLKILR